MPVTRSRSVRESARRRGGGGLACTRFLAAVVLWQASLSASIGSKRAGPYRNARIPAPARACTHEPQTRSSTTGSVPRRRDLCRARACCRGPPRAASACRRLLSLHAAACCCSSGADCACAVHACNVASAPDLGARAGLPPGRCAPASLPSLQCARAHAHADAAAPRRARGSCAYPWAFPSGDAPESRGHEHEHWLHCLLGLFFAPASKSYVADRRIGSSWLFAVFVR